MDLNLLRNQKLGITILGGGIKSVAYAGALKALENFGIKPYSLIGSSGGAVVSASYAFGKSPEEILHHFEIFNPLKPFNPFRLLVNRGIDYTEWEKHASGLVPLDSQIENAKIKLAIRAVNLDSNDSEYITSGSAVKAVIASSAVLQGYSYNGNKYIDGDYDPETSVEQHKNFGAEITLVCYLKFNNSRSPIKMFITQSNALQSDIQIHKPDAVIEIPAEQEFFLSKKNIHKNFNSGYVAMNKFLESL